MNEKRLKELGVPDDAISKVMEEWNQANSSLMHENDSYKAQAKEYEKQVNQLKEFKGSNEELTAKLAQLQADHKAAQEKFTKDMADYRKSQAIKYALGTMKEGKPHDSNIVLGLLDCTKIDVDDDGNIKGGFDEQISALKKDKGFLFSEPQVRKGVTPPSTVTVEQKTAPAMSFGARIAARAAGTASNT